MAGTVPARLSPAEGRKFGVTVGIAFALLSGLVWWRGKETIAIVLGSLAVGLIVAGLVIPGKLGPVYRGWMAMALAISKVTTPIFLGIVYFLPITVTGLIMRLLGRNPMRHPETEGSFWAAHEGNDDLRRQF